MKKEIVDFADWEKLDLRVGKILEVKEIEGADKLYKLIVDVGEKRTVCAGLKQYYSKKELLGKQVILFVNLAPRKLRGIESQGMILACVSAPKGVPSVKGDINTEGKTKVKLIIPDEDIEVGSKIR